MYKTTKTPDEIVNEAGLLARREAFIKLLKQYKSYTETEIQEYVEGAEDLNGPEYWETMTWDELVADIRLYFDSK